MTRRRSNGGALLEALVSLALLGLFIPPLIRAAGTMSSASSEVTESIGRFEEALAVRQLMRTILAELDGHPLPLPPAVHRNGQIRASSGELNGASLRSDMLAPDPASDAISSLALDLGAGHRVKQCSTESGGALFEGCGTRYSPDGYRSFLGIGADGMRELAGVSAALRGTGCRTFRLAVVPSMVVPASGAFDLCSVSLLIPIERSYTLYLDRNGMLRFLGHEGIANIENQPVTALSGSLRITLSTEEAHGLYHLSVSLAFSERDDLPILDRATNLARIHPLTLAFNR